FSAPPWCNGRIRPEFVDQRADRLLGLRVAGHRAADGSEPAEQPQQQQRLVRRPEAGPAPPPAPPPRQQGEQPLPRPPRKPGTRPLRPTASRPSDVPRRTRGLSWARRRGDSGRAPDV